MDKVLMPFPTSPGLQDFPGKMQVAYIAHPIGGDVPGNLDKIREIVRRANLTFPHVVPFAPYYLDCIAMDDNNPEERARGIRNDTALLKAGFINQMWLFGDRISIGMAAEIELAHELGIKVIPMTGETMAAYNEKYGNSETNYLRKNTGTDY